MKYTTYSGSERDLKRIYDKEMYLTIMYPNVRFDFHAILLEEVDHEVD